MLYYCPRWPAGRQFIFAICPGDKNFSADAFHLMNDLGPILYWDSTYAIAQALIDHHPDLKPVDIGLQELADLVENLPGFGDDTALVNERLLLDIQITWYEEMTTT